MHRQGLEVPEGFLMILIRQEDCDCLRFLWVDNLEEKEPKVVILWFTRVVFGILSSPFLLNVTLRHHLEKFVSVQPILVHSPKKLPLYQSSSSPCTCTKNSDFHLYMCSTFLF